MITKSYTKECITALQWFARHEPVGSFDQTSSPKLSMRLALERRGLIERFIPHISLPKFRLTEEGRQALRDAQR